MVQPKFPRWDRAIFQQLRARLFPLQWLIHRLPWQRFVGIFFVRGNAFLPATLFPSATSIPATPMTRNASVSQTPATRLRENANASNRRRNTPDAG